jgi:diacylglycerol kinase family enzyme
MPVGTHLQPAAILINEGAGTAATQRTRRTVELVRRRLDADLHVTNTRDVAELEAWLRERIDSYRTVVVVGGDGSLGVTYNVVAGRSELVLGYIPAGIGNATAHLLHLPRRPEELAEVIFRAEAHPVDLVAVDGRLALFAGAGWDALVAGRYVAGGARRLPGWAGAVAASVPDLWRRRDVEVRADGWRVYAGPMEFAVVSTTPFYGRGLRVNPGARSDRGRLTLRVYDAPPGAFAAETARWLFRVRPRARPIFATSVELHTRDGQPITLQADGDVIDARPSWHFEIRPAAVRLIGRWS